MVQIDRVPTRASRASREGGIEREEKGAEAATWVNIICKQAMPQSQVACWGMCWRQRWVPPLSICPTLALAVLWTSSRTVRRSPPFLVGMALSSSSDTPLRRTIIVERSSFSSFVPPYRSTTLFDGEEDDVKPVEAVVESVVLVLRDTLLPIHPID